MTLNVFPFTHFPTLTTIEIGYVIMPEHNKYLYFACFAAKILSVPEKNPINCPFKQRLSAKLTVVTVVFVL